MAGWDHDGANAVGGGSRKPSGAAAHARPTAPDRPQAKCHFFKNDDFGQVLTELPAKGSVAKTKSERLPWALGSRWPAAAPCGPPAAHKPPAAAPGGMRHARQ